MKTRIYDRWYWPWLMLLAMMAGTFGGAAWFMGKLLVCVGV